MSDGWLEDEHDRTVDQLDHYRRRALKAEAEVKRLRKERDQYRQIVEDNRRAIMAYVEAKR